MLDNSFRVDLYNLEKIYKKSNIINKLNSYKKYIRFLNELEAY